MKSGQVGETAASLTRTFAMLAPACEAAARAVYALAGGRRTIAARPSKGWRRHVRRTKALTRR